MAILRVKTEFGTQIVTKAARIEVANLRPLTFVPEVLVVIRKAKIWKRISIELDGDISALNFAFSTLEAAITTSYSLGFGVLLPYGVSDG